MANNRKEKIKIKVKGFWSEFKVFAIKGSVIDLAVAIIIGTAFNNVVQSLVHDVIMPPIGRLMGDVDFSQLYLNLSGKTYSSMNAAVLDGAPIIRYGLFINNIINFLIIAFTIFIILKVFFRTKFEPKE